jgi:alpha-D-ribose 1-methylphosphonate 5-triphosphate diphosphatase PhnM
LKRAKDRDQDRRNRKRNNAKISISQVRSKTHYRSILHEELIDGRFHKPGSVQLDTDCLPAMAKPRARVML